MVVNNNNIKVAEMQNFQAKEETSRIFPGYEQLTYWVAPTEQEHISHPSTSTNSPKPEMTIHYSRKLCLHAEIWFSGFLLQTNIEKFHLVEQNKLWIQVWHFCCSFFYYSITISHSFHSATLPASVSVHCHMVCYILSSCQMVSYCPKLRWRNGQLVNFVVPSW